MKKILASICCLSLLISLSAVCLADNPCHNCGQPVSESAAFCPYCGTRVPAENGPTAYVSGSDEEGDLRIDFLDGVVIYDNSLATVRLMSIYHGTEKHVVKDVNGTPGYASDTNIYLELKVRNNSNRDYLFNIFDCYVGDEGVSLSAHSGNDGPAPGKSNTYLYSAAKKVRDDLVPLDDPRALLRLDIQLSFAVYDDTHTVIEEIFEKRVDFSEILAGLKEEVLSEEKPELSGAEAVLTASKWENHNNGIYSYFLFEADGTGVMYNGVFLFNTEWQLEDDVIHLRFFYGGSSSEADYLLIEDEGSRSICLASNHSFLFTPTSR